MTLGGHGSTALLERPTLTVAPAHRRQRWPRWWSWWPAALGALVGAAVFGFAYRAAPDDALITLAYARNVVDHGCWCITTGVEVNTATSPLTVWLYAALYAVTGHALWAAGLLFVACYAAIGGWLHRLAGPFAVVAGLGLLASSPILTASIGMETLLGVTVLCGAVRFAVTGRWPLVAVAVAAAPLTRPDLAAGVVCAVMLCGCVTRAWRPMLVAFAAGAALTVPWYAFSWWHFGSIWPDTLPVKAQQPGWGKTGTVHLWNSLPSQLATSPVPIWLTVAVLVGGLVAAAVAVERRDWAPVAVAAGGIVEFAALCTSATTPVVYYPGIVVGALSLTLALVAGRSRWLLVWPAVTVVAGLVFTAHHAADIRAGFDPLRQNWATNAQYAQIAQTLPTDGPVYSPGEIGALAFYCQDRGCRVVDPFLADPGTVDTYVARWRTAHPGLAFNYTQRGPAAAPTATRYRMEFTYPAYPQQPDDIATRGGGPWNPGFERTVTEPATR